jgi:hypothetical protein
LQALQEGPMLVGRQVDESGENTCEIHFTPHYLLTQEPEGDELPRGGVVTATWRRRNCHVVMDFGCEIVAKMAGGQFWLVRSASI